MIGHAIESILNQTYYDFELLLMDDNSDENTQKVIIPFLKDRRIQFFRSNTKSIAERVQKTRYAALINQALDIAKGEYVSYATDDNIYLQNRLEKMVDYLDALPYVQIVYSASKTTYINGAGNVLKTVERSANKITQLASCIVDHCSIMHRQMILPLIYEKWGSYWDEDPQFYRIGDARFFWRLNHFWPFYPIQEVLDNNYITEHSLHHLLFSEEKCELIKQMPLQRTCKELRDDLRNMARGVK